MDAARFEDKARSYIDEALPHAGPKEKEKLYNDWIQKKAAAEGIVDDFKKRVGDPKRARILDIGFGNGITLAAFAGAGAHMEGVEVSGSLHDIASEYLHGEGINARLHLYDGRSFPFENDVFEYAYSISVLEHVSDPAAVVSEIWRVLKPGGKFYLAFPNRINPKETHTGIWFLSYVPRPVAGFLLSLSNRNTLDDWNLHFLSYFWLKRLLKKNRIPFRVLDESRKGSGIKRMLKRILALLGVHHSALLPHVMVVLEKVPRTRQ